MNEDQRLSYYELSKEHKETHNCGGVPYEHGDILMTLVAAIGAQKILEVGTGIGYSAACLIAGNVKAHVDTIDQDSTHLSIAQNEWTKLGIEKHITILEGKAEGILPMLKDQYDFIFYDGYVPQNKIYVAFENLLKKGGILITANLYLHDPTGGNYLRKLQNEMKWQTGLFADTAISVKLTEKVK